MVPPRRLFFWLLLQLLACLDPRTVVSAACSGNHDKTRKKDLHVPQLSSPPIRIYLDVDNCLYRDAQIFPFHRRIEGQIVRGIHAYCQDRLGLTTAQTDGLYDLFGSTEEGLRRTIWKNATLPQLRAHLADYYQQIYTPVDVSALLPGASKHSSSSSSGYSHGAQQQQQQHRTLGKLLKAATTTTSGPLSNITLSSNSPSFHIYKVLQAMGLCRAVAGMDILSPDTAGLGTLSNNNKEAVFPTKASPLTYFGKQVLSHDNHNDKTGMVLIDDSVTNLKAVQRYMVGRHVTDQQSVLHALCHSWGWLDETYQFSSLQYLQAKNQMDQQSIHLPTWNTMLQCLGQELSKRSQPAPLTIVDVGAGLLSMHRLLLHQDGQVDDMPSLLSSLQSCNEMAAVTQINYIAYEPNQDLRIPCIEYLLNQGYVLVEEYAWDAAAANTQQEHVHEVVFEKEPSPGQVKVRVSLRFWDFERNIVTQGALSPDIIVGCCFADLMDPRELTGALLRCFLNKPEDHQTSALVYFPITFRGITQFIPSSPSTIHKGKKVIPSDTQAFAAYSKILVNDFGHSLNPNDLVEAVQNHGGELVAQGSSDWNIHARDNEYLWRTMMYFFGTGAAPELQSMGYDAAGWIKRAWELRPMIQASNTDLLFRLPYIGRWKPPSPAPTRVPESETDDKVLEIQFTAPKEVSFVPKRRCKLKDGEIRIKSLCSLISSGTELKIFTGSFDDAALDVNIKSMEGQRMGYPLSYGYSLVGRVVECGDGVDADVWMGKNIFTFSSHATEVVTQATAVHLIPDGLDPFDAIFMPSVETALSIVHDAHPRLGEKMVVFGQGLIGLLVTALLSSMTMQLETPSLTTVDTFAERLALSALLGSQQAVLPSEVGSCGEFDVAIEASGNFRALQSAIDYTRNGGRVIIASWYGNEPASLKLGIDFHRSHKTIRTSQVSELPAELRETWTKQRRFDLTWELVKDLRPSRLLTRMAHPSNAREVYEELYHGSQISVAFDYTKTKE